MKNLNRGRIPLLGALAFLVAFFGLQLTSASAAPGDPLPTAPLSEVHPGDVCEARTVLHGTAISSFDVEVIEVIDKSGIGYGSLIYFRIVDPDVAAIGVAEGMSGSPILCHIAGEDKVVGSIAYGFSGVGPKGFATPINDVLGDGPAPVPMAGQADRPPLTHEGRRLHELSTPLMVTGVPVTSRKLVRKHLKQRGYDSVSFAGPSTVDVASTSPDLAPGGAFSINYAYGDVSIGAICTITYRDGNDFWGCGHPLDLSGQRSISISGAYIFDVLGQPWSDMVVPYKFGAATSTQVGSLLYDGPFAVAGRLGVEAPSIPVSLTLKSDGVTTALESRVANENGIPGGSPFPFITPGLIGLIMTDQAQFRTAQPTMKRGRVCLKQTIRGVNRKVEACSRFGWNGSSTLSSEVWTGAGAPAEVLVGASEALPALIQYKTAYAAALNLNIEMETGPAHRRIIGLHPIGKLRAGKVARLRMVTADRNGRLYNRTLRFRIPRKPVTSSGRAIDLKKQQQFRLGSTAFFYEDPFFGGTSLAMNTDESAFSRYLSAPIRNAKSLDAAIRGAFGSKGTLQLEVPWRSKPVTFPLGGGGDIVVGRIGQRAKVIPAPGRRPAAGSVR